ncbi:hypothetical protein R9X47_11010 [Wukongibacter baidiensis]|uniref:hypothetical protein n=1 Tax=Wukongibacter baidiensis TaxID=1723361 RepID=UPI003D7FAF77
MIKIIGLKRTIIIFTIIIIFLAVLSSTIGIFSKTEGDKFEFTTLRGETVPIQGSGLYRYDSVSMASQAIAQDIVTLVIGLPLMIIALVLFKNNKLKGKLLLAGTLGYFLYTYISYAFLAAYNKLFIVYVILFSLSLFSFIFTLQTIDIEGLSYRFPKKLPKKVIAGFSIFIGNTILLMWMGRIIPSLISNAVPVGLESYSTLVIQALDVGIIVPIAILSAVLLLRNRPWGYLLASVFLIKSVTLSAAVSAMALAQIKAGIEISKGEAIIFPTIFIVSSVLSITLLASVYEKEI